MEGIKIKLERRQHHDRPDHHRNQGTENHPSIAKNGNRRGRRIAFHVTGGNDGTSQRKQREQGREKRRVGHQRHKHAAAGNQPQFGKPSI